MLDVDASAVYLFDADANELHPATYSAEMEALNGPLPTVPADGESLPSYSFVENEPRFFADVHDAERLENRATELRSGAYIPLGEHGVFVFGTDAVDTYDGVRRELADLLAATAEAALDRVTRETRLREQDRELQRRNEEFSTLDRINETIREIDQALVRAETREEIDHTVCELLTADDRFSFAWIRPSGRTSRVSMTASLPAPNSRCSDAGPRGRIRFHDPPDRVNPSVSDPSARARPSSVHGRRPPALVSRASKRGVRSSARSGGCSGFRRRTAGNMPGHPQRTHGTYQ